MSPSLVRENATPERSRLITVCGASWATLGLLELQGRISTTGGRIAVCTAK